MNLTTDILDANIGSFDKRLNLRKDIREIVISSKIHTHGMPKEYFVAITNLYADFVKGNIKEIIEWKYSV